MSMFQAFLDIEDIAIDEVLALSQAAQDGFFNKYQQWRAEENVSGYGLPEELSGEALIERTLDLLFDESDRLGQDPVEMTREMLLSLTGSHD